MPVGLSIRPAGVKHHPDLGALLVLVFVQWSDCKCVDEGFLGKTVGILDVCSALALLNMGEKHRKLGLVHEKAMGQQK